MANEDETAGNSAVKERAPFHYIVREPFGKYRKGHRLTDAETIAAAHTDGHASKLVRVPADPEFVEA